jgi:hypothetical protein
MEILDPLAHFKAGRMSQKVQLWAAIAGIVAAIVAILTYFNLQPERKQPPSSGSDTTSATSSSMPTSKGPVATTVRTPFEAGSTSLPQVLVGTW